MTTLAGGETSSDFDHAPSADHHFYTNIDGTLLDETLQIVPDAPDPSHHEVIQFLNNLYASESRSFFRYLVTWKPYTTIDTIRLASSARKMSQRSYQHADILARHIASLGGVTATGAYAASDSDANYTTWKNILPRLIATKQDLCHRYEVIIPHIQAARAAFPTDGQTGEPGVIEQLEQMLRDNHDDLIQLQEWAQRLK